METLKDKVKQPYIVEEHIPALWRPPCACGIALPVDLYKKEKLKDQKKATFYFDKYIYLGGNEEKVKEIIKYSSSDGF